MRQRCTLMRNMPVRAALVTALIVERPMCEACILNETMPVAAPRFRSMSLSAAAGACGETKRVLSLDRPT